MGLSGGGVSAGGLKDISSFKLPTSEVSITSTNTPQEPGGVVTVDVDVSNTGELRKQNGVLELDDGSGSVVDSVSYTKLNVSQSLSFQLSWDTTGVSSGSRNITALSGGFSAVKSVDVVYAIPSDTTFTEAGTHTIDVSFSSTETDIQVSGQTGGDGLDGGFGNDFNGGDGGNGGFVRATVDLSQIDTLTFTVSDFAGGAEGEQSDTNVNKEGQEGGAGGNSTAVEGGGELILEGAGGGGGGGAGEEVNNYNGYDGGNGGGSQASGGSGGSGGGTYGGFSEEWNGQDGGPGGTASPGSAIVSVVESTDGGGTNGGRAKVYSTK